MLKTKKYIQLFPIAGTLLFVLLYVAATLCYPGGSQADEHAAGFSWRYNYWCNLLNDTAINGRPNSAKPVALVAMLVLCSTLSCFWVLFPLQIPLSKTLRRTIQISGVGSMLVAFFLFAGSAHDIITNTASGFGVVATIGTFIALYRIRWWWLFAFGAFNLLLVGVNNYVYYIKGMLTYLPVVQKVTFISFLLWIDCISMKLYKHPETRF